MFWAIQADFKQCLGVFLRETLITLEFRREIGASAVRCLSSLGKFKLIMEVLANLGPYQASVVL